MAYKISRPKAKEKVFKGKLNSFNINAHNYSWESDDTGKMKVSLGNMSDSGWYWNGDQNDLNGFIYRLNTSKVRNEFLNDVKSNGISFQQIKPQLLKSVEKGDGIYEMSGDNVVWKFGNTDNDVDDSYEFDEEGITDKNQQHKVYEEYRPVTIDQFEKSQKSSYKEQMKKAVKESNTFEEFMEYQDDISLGLIEARMSENGQKFLEAIRKVKKGKK